MTLKPSVIPSIYKISKALKKVGLTQDNLITLIQRDTKLSRSNIEKTLDALRKIEQQIISAQKR